MNYLDETSTTQAREVWGNIKAHFKLSTDEPIKRILELIKLTQIGNPSISDNDYTSYPYVIFPQKLIEKIKILINIDQETLIEIVKKYSDTHIQERIRRSQFPLKSHVVYKGHPTFRVIRVS